MAEIEISMKVLEDEVMEFAQKLEQKYIERKMEKKNWQTSLGNLTYK